MVPLNESSVIALKRFQPVSQNVFLSIEYLGMAWLHQMCVIWLWVGKWIEKSHTQIWSAWLRWIGRWGEVNEFWYRTRIRIQFLTLRRWRGYRHFWWFYRWIAIWRCTHFRLIAFFHVSSTACPLFRWMSWQHGFAKKHQVTFNKNFRVNFFVCQFVHSLAM